MYLHKTKNGHYTPPCCYFSGELEVVECLGLILRKNVLEVWSDRGASETGRAKKRSDQLTNKNQYCANRTLL